MALLETLARSEPPQGRTHWTMQLLVDRPFELQVVDSISDETARKEVRKSASGLG